MILNLDRQPAGECFRELDDALAALGRGDVCLNAHVAPDGIPDGATVWHFENQPCEYPKAREVWTFSKRQAEATGWRHVPVRYHPSMERFQRAAVQDIDVVHVGCLNERRAKVLNELAARGVSVAHIPPGIYGKDRDSVLARAKLCVVPLFYPDGVFCSLRAAHLVANKVPMLVEDCPERWSFVQGCGYDDLVDRAIYGPPLNLAAHMAFVSHPMRLPS